MYLLGGSGSDTFVLGRNDGICYLGLNNPVITDFNWSEDDKMKVRGNSSYYSLITGNWGGSSAQDTALYSGGDCIALIRDRSGLSLSLDFIYLGTGSLYS